MIGSPDETCARCGDPITAEEWHPVAVRRDEAGDLHVYGFCCETCKEKWESDASRET